MPTEIELKLSVAGKHLPQLREALKQHAEGVKAHRRRLISHYFDTSDTQLWKNRIALRVRSVDGQWVQTLKGGGGVHAGVHQRAEWETPVAQNCPDLQRLAAAFPDDRPLRQLIKKLPDSKEIQAVFSTDFHRDAIVLTLPDGSEVEAAVDEGEVVSGRKRTPISELEIELKSGDPAAVFELARQLLTVAPFTISSISKAERGYALAQPARLAAPRRAQSVKFTPSTTVEDAFVAIFSECLDHLLGNVDGFVAGESVEYLHQMRVAIRRLRAALAIFGNVMPEIVLASLVAELRHAGQILGEARNWDVLRFETLPAYAKAAKTEISAELADRLQQNAQKAMVRTQRYVRSPRFTGLLLAIGSFILGRTWRHAATEATLAALADSVGVFAGTVVDKRRRRLQKRVAAIQPTLPETLHAVRIAAKKLRYLMQFLVSLFQVKPAQSYTQRLAEMQDLLGEMNDAAVAERLLAETSVDSSTLTDEIAAIGLWLEAQMRHDQDLFNQAWNRFAKLRVLPK